MSNPVPSLSSSAWVTEPGEKADRLLSYFFLSEHLQSNLYAGNVASLPHIIKTYGHDELALTSSMRDTLTTLFQRYFDEVDLDVKITTVDAKTLAISLSAILTQGGVGYNMAKEISTLDSKVVKIMDANNG